MKSRRILCAVLVTAMLTMTACNSEKPTDEASESGTAVTTASTALNSSANTSSVDTASAQSSSADSSATNTEQDTVKEEENEASAEEPAKDEKVSLAEVEFSEESGVYAEEFALSLSCDGATAIYYTTDGSDPLTSKTRIKYEGDITIDDRKSAPNVVSAVTPDKICWTFYEYDRSTRSLSCGVNAPEDTAVDKCTVIRAAAEMNDGTSSAICSGTYFIGTPEEHIEGIAKSCAVTGEPLAVISIAMEYDDLFNDETGIYVKGNIFAEAEEEWLKSNKADAEKYRKLAANYNQRGKKWERQASMQLLEMDADGAVTELSQLCGIRIQGNYSRSDWQKGLRLYARGDYGESKFKYEVFGEELLDEEGKAIDKFDTLTLRAGGNCAFNAKFNDTYWQRLAVTTDCDTKMSRPCVVYINGEYWGLYVLEEDYSDYYFQSHYGVEKEDVVCYKGDAETYESGYKLDIGDIPDGEDEDYYFNNLYKFFSSHSDTISQEDYDELAALVDAESCLDYFAVETWINNKWDWPGKNWAMWKTTTSGENYGDGKWRFSLFDIEFGGISGWSDVETNTVREDNYKTYGLLDFDTNNPAVLCFAYFMTNEGFRTRFCDRLFELSDTIFESENALQVLGEFEGLYAPLFDQFFERYPGSGDTEESLEGDYASVDCIEVFVSNRADTMNKIVKWINKHFE